MRLSALQKYIILQCFNAKGGKYIADKKLTYVNVMMRD